MAIRAFALRAGELTRVGEDIFFLTVHEVLRSWKVTTPPANSSPCARRRSSATAPCRRTDDHRRRFDPSVGGDPTRRSDIFWQTPGAAPEPDAGTVIKGFPGRSHCPGHSAAPRRRRRAATSGRGDLVTTLTNIGWTPLFPRAAAIVTDLGAPLSHAAIIAASWAFRPSWAAGMPRCACTPATGACRRRPGAGGYLSPQL